MMRNSSETEEETDEQLPVRKDRSLLYMGITLGVIILVMGYMTFFVDEPWKLFKKSEQKEQVEEVNKGNSNLLDESSSMNDEEIRSSLVKFIDAYYYDEKRGYFDPPSYFATITETFYNFHNLTYSRLKDLYWQRRQDMENLRRTWIVSTLKFERQGDRIVSTHWVKETYYKPSIHSQYSAQVQYEIIIDAEGKIVSLRDVDIKNERIEPLAIDTLSVPSEAVLSTESQGSDNTATVVDNKIYNTSELDVQPEFNGGQKEMIKYVSTNIKYPLAARQANIQGKVQVSFVIEKDGSVTDVKVTKGIEGGCDEEAVRLIRNAPKWRPGVAHNAIVRTLYTLPITFQIAN